MGQIDGFDDPGDLVDEGDGASDVIKDLTIPDLLPRHRHVLHQLQHGVRHVLEGAQINALVVAEFSVGVVKEEKGRERIKNEWKEREEQRRKKKNKLGGEEEERKGRRGGVKKERRVKEGREEG